LISYGHPPGEVWNYTLRQLNGYLMLASERRKKEKASELALATLAARGSPDSLKKQLRELER